MLKLFQLKLCGGREIWLKQAITVKDFTKIKNVYTTKQNWYKYVRQNTRRIFTIQREKCLTSLDIIPLMILSISVSASLPYISSFWHKVKILSATPGK
jgi:hypothetical protein